ncbi:hypothetical protein CORC01_11712 [Colletotrichum orchidophilum]|uniref:Beta/gamma crystallin 'Greek key' domain-containing protein n=1 Tax=Colletotrichum orchidophilum TaxID=1209926 RepID=A0A1G4AUZ3_9PEZI|nr:uncharacterized protein CORC01_11712 [Colletotrichum orchidophilum]OHE92989.1 hypothetical protein CORC01_11712 [Colletotrichum orchidophilum]
MVCIKSFIGAQAFQALAIMASPTPQISKDTGGELMAQASIYMCEHTYWNGQCRNELVDLNRCYNVPGGWNDRISSIRNDSKSFYKCVWYLDGNCQGGSYENQEDANLADGNGRFNDSISSYSCKQK